MSLNQDWEASQHTDTSNAMSDGAVKTTLRRQLLRARQSLDVSVRAAHADAIQQHVLTWLQKYPLPKGGTVALYTAIRAEVDVWPLIHSLTELGFAVALPKTEPGQGTMEFYQIEPDEPLVPGVFGILEPHIGTKTPVAPDSLALLLIPGLAFTKQGLRLGYGGGYYDRWFATHTTCALRVGVGFAAQVLAALPREEHDQVMDYLVTERGVTSCRLQP